MAADPSEIEFIEPEGGEQPEEESREDALMAAIDEAESLALGAESDQLNVDRATALDYYLGQPMGNEIEGRSQVVSRDVFDSVEWAKPSLLRIFAGGEKIAHCEPQGDEDVEAAEQESDYVDFVIQRRNNWFGIANEWITDALVTRNAYAFAHWEDRQEASIERYSGLTDNAMAMIASDPGVALLGHTSYQAPVQVPFQVSPIQQALQQTVAQFHDIEVRRRTSYGCVKIEVLPPERCVVQASLRTMSVKDSDFFEYWEYKTLSELRVSGFDVPDDISDDRGGTDRGLVDQARDSFTNNYIQLQQQETTDPAMRKIKTRMIWIRQDYDGDGIAEKRYVVAVGKNILVNEEVSFTPVSCIVPIPMPTTLATLSANGSVAPIT